MKVFRSRWLPLRGYAAMNVFGIIIARHDVSLPLTLLNHERIHTAQMRELGFLPFYVLYMLEWLVRLVLPGKAYRNISFEREAYGHDHNLDYLKQRKHFAQWRKVI